MILSTANCTFPFVPPYRAYLAAWPSMGPVYTRRASLEPWAAGAYSSHKHKLEGQFLCAPRGLRVWGVEGGRGEERGG